MCCHARCMFLSLCSPWQTGRLTEGMYLTYVRASYLGQQGKRISSSMTHRQQWPGPNNGGSRRGEGQGKAGGKDGEGEAARQGEAGHCWRRYMYMTMEFGALRKYSVRPTVLARSHPLFSAV